MAEYNGLKNKQANGVVDALFGVACVEDKKKKAATPVKKDINPFTKDRGVFKTKTTCRQNSGKMCTPASEKTDAEAV